VTEPREISAIVREVAPRPINVLVSGFNSDLSVAQVADLGVRRISVGSGLALAAWGAMTRAAREISDKGTFGGLTGGARSAELNELFWEET
jgi:2-methylisocitrate lyase-like PEP mutase family enzyme